MKKQIDGYAGFRDDEDSTTEVVVYEAGSQCVTRVLSPRLDVRNHSPSGFEWGYHGSGPAQLALAILLDYLEDEGRAQELYQKFKADFVAKFPKRRWELLPDEIDAWLESQK